MLFWVGVHHREPAEPEGVHRRAPGGGAEFVHQCLSPEMEKYSGLYLKEQENGCKRSSIK